MGGKLYKALPFGREPWNLVFLHSVIVVVPQLGLLWLV